MRSAVRRQVKFFSTRSRPACPMRRQSSGSERRRRSACAERSRVGRRHQYARNAVLDISDRAPARVAITGTPQAIASTAGRPNPSYSDGETTIWLRLYSRTSSFGAGARQDLDVVIEAVLLHQALDGLQVQRRPVVDEG